MKNAKCLLSFVFAGTATIAHGQSTLKPLDSIVIVENRWQSPLANKNRDVQIITADRIKTLPVKSISELLAYTSGVDIRQRGPWGTQADLSIDGSTFDQVAVLLNGVRMSDPQTGHNMMNLPVPLSAIDHIEIIRGAASAVYGVNALAGVVNIVTKVPDANAVSGEIYGGSSFENDTSTGALYGGWGVQASAALHTGKLAQRLSFAHDQSSGYRYNTANKSYKLYYQNELALSRKTSMSASAGYINNDFGASLFYAAPKDPEATENVQTVAAALSLTYRPVESWRIMGRGSLRYNKDNYIFIRQSPEAYQNIHETSVVNAEVQATKSLAHGHVGFGVEGRNEDMHSNSLGKRNRNNAGVYLEYGHSFGRGFSAGANLYFNNNTDYGSKLYPALDLGYRLHPDWKLFANAGMSQRLPTFTDLYYKSQTNIGNDALRPEEAICGEGGIKYTGATQKLTLRYAYRSVTDFIDWVRDDVQDAWQPRNFGQMNVQVLNVSGSQSLDAILHLPAGQHLWFDASWTHLQPERGNVEEAFTKYATDALKEQVILGLRVDLKERISASINGRYLQRINSGDYTLLDIHLQYNLNTWQVFADVNNLLDTDYTEVGTVPLPGRWISAGLRFKGLY